MSPEELADHCRRQADALRDLAEVLERHDVPGAADWADQASEQLISWSWLLVAESPAAHPQSPSAPA